MEDSIIEEHDIGSEEKQPVKDNRDIEEEEDKTSITDENATEDDKPTTEKAVEEEKKSDSEEEKKSTNEEANAAGAVQRNVAAAPTKPTPLPRTIKWHKVWINNCYSTMLASLSLSLLSTQNTRHCYV